MLRVGLTGGLGSGKTTAANLFQQLGAHVIKADVIGRELMQPGTDVFRHIVAHFGESILTPSGEIDRPALAQIVFASGEARTQLEALNAIVHPAVIDAQLHWLDDLAQRDPHAIAIVESALIFESPHAAKRSFDRIILVAAQEEIKVARFVARAAAGKPVSAEERLKLESDALHRIARQLPDAEKAHRSDYVIHNDGTLDELTEQVRQIYVHLVEEEQRPA